MQLSRFKRGMPRTLTVDTSWIVPYSPDLLRKFKTHMNLELCISKVVSIKYLFKYVCKGPDHVTVEVQAGQADECTESTPRKFPPSTKFANSKTHDMFPPPKRHGDCSRFQWLSICCQSNDLK